LRTEQKHRKSTSSLTIFTSSTGSTNSSSASSPTLSVDSSKSSQLSNSLSVSSSSSSSSTPSNKKKKKKKSRSISATRDKKLTSKNKKRKTTSKSPDPTKNNDEKLNNKKKKVKLENIDSMTKQQNKMGQDKSLKKKLQSATACRSKSLDKEALSTLAKMHNHVVKSAQIDVLSGSNHSLKMTSEPNFNIKTMTNLTDENLDNKLLKDCKISPKLIKNYKKETRDKLTLSNNNASIRSNSLPRQIGNSKCDSLKNKSISELSTQFSKSSKKNGDVLTKEEEILARRELGDSIMNAVDGFLSNYIIKNLYII
jgi:ferredoxin-fold anticodon binding domain-containing protein